MFSFVENFINLIDEIVNPFFSIKSIQVINEYPEFN